MHVGNNNQLADGATRNLRTKCLGNDSARSMHGFYHQTLQADGSMLNRKAWKSQIQGDKLVVNVMQVIKANSADVMQLVGPSVNALACLTGLQGSRNDTSDAVRS